MDAEKYFEEWWAQRHAYKYSEKDCDDRYEKETFFEIFALGRQSGLVEGRKESYEEWWNDSGEHLCRHAIAQGCIAGLEEAAKLVESKRWENRNDCAEAIRRRIKEVM
ncbi:hypothetical protein HGA64_03720 [Candidatus Falkowbacteria bacterium]|nr:hypothetical protein [Candidatus Falkowbacteria bacterium]